jgi:hypothetical protein
MPSPQTILAFLLGGAIGAGGILQGLHWRATRVPTDSAELKGQLRGANEELELLRRENESLRAIAHGSGGLSVPPELITRTEREFGLRFLTKPAIRRIASDNLRDRIAAAIEIRTGPSGIGDRQDAFRLIGWLRPDDDLLAQLTAIQALGKDGWFDGGSGEGWMPDRANLANIPEQAALVRLLARILFHQHFPPESTYPGDDAARAREALHEGAAAGAEARFYAEKARTEGFMPMTENAAFKLLFASLPPFLQGLATFPEVEGRGYADSLHVRGNEPLHAAFRNPPQTTRAIMSPGENDAAIGIAQPEGIGEPFLTESAGQLGLLLWLRPLDETVASEIAAAWRGDRYFLIPDGEISTAVLWDIELASPEAADRLETLASEKAAAMENERHLAVTRISPTRVRFINAAEAVTN